MLRRFSGKLKLYRRYGRRCLDVRQKSAEPEPALTAPYTEQSMGEGVQGHSPPCGFTGA